jgi:hypothetical protein
MTVYKPTLESFKTFLTILPVIVFFQSADIWKSGQHPGSFPKTLCSIAAPRSVVFAIIFPRIDGMFIPPEHRIPMQNDVF